MVSPKRFETPWRYHSAYLITLKTLGGYRSTLSRRFETLWACRAAYPITLKTHWACRAALSRRFETHWACRAVYGIGLWCIGGGLWGRIRRSAFRGFTEGVNGTERQTSGGDRGGLFRVDESNHLGRIIHERLAHGAHVFIQVFGDGFFALQDGLDRKSKLFNSIHLVIS